jgi:hypothetical protein
VTKDTLGAYSNIKIKCRGILNFTHSSNSRKKILRFIHALIRALCLVIVSAITPTNSSAEELQRPHNFALIVNRSSPYKTPIMKNAAVQMFTGEIKAWPNGLPIAIVVMRANSDGQDIFSQEYLGIMPYQFERLWQREVYAGISAPPHRAMSASDMADIVNRTLGAIGFIENPGTFKLPDNVRVLETK